MKTNAALWRNWFRLHQFPNSFEYNTESLVIFFLHFIKSAEEVGVRSEQLPNLKSQFVISSY